MPRVRLSQGPRVETETIRPAYIDAPRAAGRDAAQLSRGLAGISSAAGQIAEQEASRQAYEVDALVKSSWAETEQTLRQKYQGTNADGYLAELDTWWNDAASDSGTRLGAGARAQVTQSLTLARRQAYSAGVQYVAGEKNRAQEEAFKASKIAERQRALNDMRPEALAASREILRQRNADQAVRKGWSAEQLEAANLDDLSQLHIGALQRLVDRDAADAELYFQTHRPEIDAGLQPQLERSLKASGRLAHAQSVADTIMGRRLPLDEAMRTVEREFSGEDEKQIKAELHSRFSVLEKTARDTQEQLYGTAQLEVEQTGRVKASTFGLLSDTHKAAVLNRIQAESRRRSMDARDKPVRTDWGLYVQLRDEQASDPEAFAKRDLGQYVDRLAGAQLEQLADLVTGTRDQARKDARKTPKDAATLTQQANAALAGAKITNAERKGKFLSHVQGEVDALAERLGRYPTFDERQPIIDRALIEGRNPDAWSITPEFIAGRRRAFEMKPEQREALLKAQPAGTLPAEPARVRDEDHFRSLPAGTRFITPDGKTGTKR